MISKDEIVLLLIVFTLRNIWTDINIINSANKATNIKLLVNNTFCFRFYLRVSDIDLNNC